MIIIKQQKKADFRVIVIDVKTGKSSTTSLADHKELTLEKLTENIKSSLEKLK
jgi:uncharacterized protein (DUF433 family)